MRPNIVNRKSILLIIVILFINICGCIRVTQLYYPSSVTCASLAKMDEFRVSIGAFIDHSDFSDRLLNGIDGIFTKDFRPEQYIQMAFTDELKYGSRYNESAPIQLSGSLDSLSWSRQSGGEIAWDITLTIISSNGHRITVSKHYDPPATEATRRANGFMPATQMLIAKIVQSPEFIGLVKYDNMSNDVNISTNPKTDTIFSSAPIRKVALIIGNADYSSTGYGHLRNSVNDASDIAKKLESFGFEVELKRNADQRAMEDAIQRFCSKLSEQSVALFYFSGHGAQLNEVNFLIPVNAKIETENDIKYAAIPAGKLLDSIEATNNKLSIVLIDACRNNPFTRGWRSIGQGLAPMQAASGMLIGYATAPGKTASDGKEIDKNSPYAKYLLKYMDIPGMPIEEVLKKVRAGVLQETNGKQIPWEASSLIGDFTFK